MLDLGATESVSCRDVCDFMLSLKVCIDVKNT